MEKGHLRSNPWRRITVITVVIVVLLLGVVFSWVAPLYLKQKIETAMSESCPKCEFQLAALRLSLFSGAVALENVKFVNDPRDPTTFRISTGQVKVWLSLIKLIQKKIEIQRLEINRFQIVIEETHRDDPPKPNPEELKKIEASYGGEFLESLPPAFVKTIIIENSSLEYVLRIFKHEAKIKVSDINAEISPMATRKGMASRYTEAHLTGKVQKSGLLSLNLKADLYSVKNEDHLEIEIQHLPMPELDTFFVKEDGLEMGGELNKIHTSLQLTQGNLSGELWANYRDLKIHVIPGPAAGPIKALFINIVESLKTAKTKPAPDKPPPRAAVAYQRKPGESLINFLLQGLKEAAFKVIAN